MLNRGTQYKAWNGALADIVYPPLEEAGPAYLSLDAEQRVAIAEQLGFGIEDFDRQLADCVCEVLGVPSQGPISLYDPLNRQLWYWWRQGRDERGAPPVLPFLAALTVAAERMASGDGMLDSNFYGRLKELLDTPDPDHLEGGYRKFGERYWSALDHWLEDQDGLRGLPTAVAIRHRFVGLPISQVLVRAADRDRLPHFFIKAGFPPGSVIPPMELAPSFDRWINSHPCPVSPPFAHHWHSSSARRQILDSVATALSMWNGHVTHHDSDESLLASLALNIGIFPKPRIEFSPIVYLTDADQPRDGDIKTFTGWDSVDLVPFAPGIMRIGEAQAFDNGSLLEGVLEVKDSLTGRRIERKPRRLMIFRRVDHAGAYLEAEQVMLGEDVMIVARNEPRLLNQITGILAACARPGWEAMPESFGGTPEGWNIFRKVQIFASPGELVTDSSIDLRALVPLTNNQLIVAGGYQLPGSIRGKWHRDALPEVRAISDDPKGFEVGLFDYGVGEGDDVEATLIHQEISGSAGPLVIDLSTLELEDGNYRVELKPKGSSQAVSSIMIRVRSGDQMDIQQLEKFGPADQFLADPLSAVYASSVQGEARIAGSVLLEVASQDLLSSGLESAPHWTKTRSQRRKLTLSLATVPPDSCIYTGAHRTNIETVEHDRHGRPQSSYTVGTCQKCGLVRQFPSTHWRAKKRETRGVSAGISQHPLRSRLSPVCNEGADPKWDVVLDAVFHTGAGNAGTFARLSAYAEPSALMAHHLIRTLSALGHIDVLRNQETLGVESWEVSPSAIVPTARGWFLSGHWPHGLVLDQLRADRSIELVKIEHPEAPTSLFFTAFPECLLPDVSVGASALDIARQLPRLSEVISALPPVPAPVLTRGLSIFDPHSAKWQDSDAMTLAGAYRIRAFSTVDVLRSHEDIKSGQMRYSTVHLGKHATALFWDAKLLMAYDPAEQTLRVPLGANLPGLYERAAVLASGIAPYPNGGSLCYPFVPPELAGHLAYLMGH